VSCGHEPWRRLDVALASPFVDSHRRSSIASPFVDRIAVRRSRRSRAGRGFRAVHDARNAAAFREAPQDATVVPRL
jgi:hypothetical protein